MDRQSNQVPVEPVIQSKEAKMHKTTFIRQTQTRRLYLHQAATATAKTYYKQQQKTRKYDQAHIFRPPLETILEYTTSQMQAWVTNTKPALVQALKDALSIDLQFTRDIREYFQLRATRPNVTDPLYIYIYTLSFYNVRLLTFA